MTREFAEARRNDLGLLLANQVKNDVLSNYRKQAFELFEKHGLPNRRNENWKYTSLDALSRSNFAHASNIEISKSVDDVLPSLDAIRIIIDNGKIAADDIENLRDAGLQFSILTDASDDKTLLNQYLTSMQDPALSPYNLNTALMQEAICIRAASNRSYGKPLLLHFVSNQENMPVASYPRIIVQLEQGSSLTVIECHENNGEHESFCTQVNQFDLQQGASLVHYSLQHGSLLDTHLSRSDVRVGEAAKFSHHGMQFGGKLLRNEMDITLDGFRARAELSGLFLPTGKQHMDNHISVIHAAPETTSNQNYRGVLNDQGRGVFNGKVVVKEAAQKTDAKQSNRNLLLSNRAEIDTKPELEIYADDVKCSHGVTTGQLDKNQLFYLLSRGIDEQTAQSLLVFAFADSVIASVAIPEIREHLEQHLVGELPDADRIKDFV